MILDHEYLWNDGPLDKIVINYAEWTHLQLNKLIDIENNYNHIKLVPRMLVESSEFMTKCLKCIIKNHKMLHYSKDVGLGWEGGWERSVKYIHV